MSHYAIEPLAKNHDRSAFACGEASLDRWLREQAGQADRKGSARVYVLCRDRAVIGYFSLSAYGVESDAVPQEARVGVRQVPAILLGRLAVDLRHQRGGVGGALLMSALRLAAEAGDRVGAALMMVHAIQDSAAAYYQQYGFRPFDSHPLTWYLPMKDVRATITAADSAWP